MLTVTFQALRMVFLLHLPKDAEQGASLFPEFSGWPQAPACHTHSYQVGMEGGGGET